MPKSKGAEEAAGATADGGEASATRGTEAPSFEVALRRLEAVVAHLEQGEQPLEQALKLFEEGIRLSRVLTARLEEAQARIDQVLEMRDGKSRLAPFGPE